MIQNSIYVIMLPKYFICMGYGHELIYAVASDKIVLEYISLYVLHAVSCLFLSMLLQQVRQCRTQARQCCGYGVAMPHPVVTAVLQCMNCHLHHVYIFDTVCSTPQQHRCRGSPFTFTKVVNLGFL